MRSPAPTASDSGSIEVTGGAAHRTFAGRPRVLAIVAHPDDELAFAGTLFKTATHLGGACEVLTITDGQGGFKYSTIGALLHGLDLTDEAVGRRELPRLRLAEQVESARLIGVRALHYLGECDHRYTTELSEVLGASARVWDLARVRGALQKRLSQGLYDFVLVLSPTAATHAHHQAATLLALEAAARLPDESRPAVLCVEVESGPQGDTSDPPRVPQATLAGHPLGRVADGPWVFDRTQKFGHRQRLDYRIVVNAAIARHTTQGSMQLLVGRGEREQYWLLGRPPPDARERCDAWFAGLAEPQFKPRTYGESAGANASTAQ